MNKEEFKQTLDKMVQNPDNQALITELATKLTDGFNEMADHHDSLENTIQEKDDKIEETQKANMQLYLRVGEKQQEQEQDQQEEQAASLEDIAAELSGGNQQ